MNWELCLKVRNHSWTRSEQGAVATWSNDGVENGQGLCLKSKTSHLDTVSTGSGSDLVSDQHAIFPTILTSMVDQVATAPCSDCVQARRPTFEAKL